MGTPHKHAEVIKAWADGKQIQFRGSDGRVWQDCNHNACLWLPSMQYRVKPETIRYRVAVIRDLSGKYFPHMVSATEAECCVQKWDCFIKWDGDWVEVEV